MDQINRLLVLHCSYAMEVTRSLQPTNPDYLPRPRFRWRHPFQNDLSICHLPEYWWTGSLCVWLFYILANGSRGGGLSNDVGDGYDQNEVDEHGYDEAPGDEEDTPAVGYFD